MPICFSLEIEPEIKKLAKRFSATFNNSAYANFHSVVALENRLGRSEIEKILGLAHSKRSSAPIFKRAGADGRIFSNYFTSVLVLERGERVFKPMRYRVRPAHSIAEIPSKYNVFNARIDALETRKTWKTIFMRKHGLVPFVRFFEWVDNNGKKELISFKPDTQSIMWAPCIYDSWESQDKQIHFESFALITDDPPPEIASKGHDRCPIFLREDLINNWLLPTGKTKKQMYELLKQVEPVYFESALAA